MEIQPAQYPQRRIDGEDALELPLGIDHRQVVLLAAEQHRGRAVAAGHQADDAADRREIAKRPGDRLNVVLHGQLRSQRLRTIGRSGRHTACACYIKRRRAIGRRTDQLPRRPQESLLVVGDHGQGMAVGHERAETDQQPALTHAGHMRRLQPGRHGPQALGQPAAGKDDAVAGDHVGRVDLGVTAALGNVHPLDPINVRLEVLPAADPPARLDLLQPLLILGRRYQRTGWVS